MESTPLVVDGVLYHGAEQRGRGARRRDGTALLDVPISRAAGVERLRDGASKGLAFAGDRLFWATYDGHLIAIDAKTGSEIWNQTDPGLEDRACS